MTVRWPGRGCRSPAERRGRNRAAGLEGPAPLWADREPGSRQFLPTPASGYAGGMPGAGNLPEGAGKTFVYAFAGGCAGKNHRRCLPGLMVAINRCENGAGKIVPGASAEI